MNFIVAIAICSFITELITWLNLSLYLNFKERGNLYESILKFEHSLTYVICYKIGYIYRETSWR